MIASGTLQAIVLALSDLTLYDDRHAYDRAFPVCTALIHPCPGRGLAGRLYYLYGPPRPVYPHEVSISDNPGEARNAHYGRDAAGSCIRGRCGSQAPEFCGQRARSGHNHREVRRSLFGNYYRTFVYARYVPAVHYHRGPARRHPQRGRQSSHQPYDPVSVGKGRIPALFFWARRRSFGKPVSCVQACLHDSSLIIRCFFSIWPARGRTRQTPCAGYSAAGTVSLLPAFFAPEGPLGREILEVSHRIPLNLFCQVVRPVRSVNVI